MARCPRSSSCSISIADFFVPSLSFNSLSLDFCAHTSFNTLYAPVKVPLQQQQQCSYCCLCSFCRHTHTYTYSRRPRIVCMYACVLCEVQLRRSSSLSLCLSHSTLTPFRLFLLSSLPFLHLISFCTKGVARPLLLLFCIHTHAH